MLSQIFESDIRALDLNALIMPLCLEGNADTAGDRRRAGGDVASLARVNQA